MVEEGHRGRKERIRGTTDRNKATPGNALQGKDRLLHRTWQVSQKPLCQGEQRDPYVSVRELEEHLKKTYSDIQRYEPVSIPDDMSPIQPPEHQINTTPPTW